MMADIPGHNQSPVDLSQLTAFEADPRTEVLWTELVVHSTRGGFRVVNPKPALVLVDGERYRAVQVHAHGPAEHWQGSSRSAGELHIVHVHQADLSAQLPLGNSRVVVLAVPLIGGDVSAAAALQHPAEQVARWLKATPAGSGGEETVSYQRGALLPKDPRALRYAGSLTTGFCEEVVTWVVFEAAVTIPKGIGEHLEPARSLQAPNRRYAIWGDVRLGPLP